MDIRVSTQDDFQKEASTAVFSFVLKIASVKKDSVLLDNVKTRMPSLKINNISFEQIGIELKFLEPNEPIFLPPSVGPNKILDFFPLIIKSDETKIIVMGIRFHYTPKSADNAVDILHAYFEANGLSVSFRINGKYRDYKLLIQPEQRS